MSSPGEQAERSRSGLAGRIGVLWLALVLALSLFASGCASQPDEPARDDGTEAPPSASPAEEPEEWVLTQLPGYPEDVVPLYEVKLLDTVYYSVRNDPQWVVVEGGLRNIYHSVYESSVPASEVLEYYRGLCDSIDADSTFGEHLSGMIGPYEIYLTAATHNDVETVYLSVDLPRDELSETNPFFEDYPAHLVELPASFAVYEEMYYHTLVRSSEVMYVRQFDVVDLDGDSQADMSQEEALSYFEERHGEADGFELDREYPSVRWNEDGYRLNVSFIEGSNRGTLTIGRDREQ